MNKRIYTLMVAVILLFTFVAPVSAAPGGSRPGQSDRESTVQEGSATTYDSSSETQTSEVETAATETELPAALGNGSFENTVLDEGDFGTGVNTNNAIAHSSGKWCLEYAQTFEAWDNWKNDDKRFYWNTTAMDKYIELGVDDVAECTERTWSYVTNADDDGEGHFLAREGSQFAELVGEETSSLYQSIATVPGEILSWGLSHRSRDSVDIMALFIGPMQDYSYTKASSDGNDIFMWMGRLLNESGLYSVISGDSVHDCSEPLTIYSKPDLTLANITDSNYTEYFSLTKTAEITEQWICRIIQDSYDAWGDFVGTYEVPEGQEATTFAFTALSSSTNAATLPNQGNLLDAIKFTYAYPLTVTSTGGGYGTVSADDADADGNTVTDVRVDYASTYQGNYLEGTGITITATPADEYHKFLGANINGAFYSYSAFTENGGSYTTELEIQTAEYVQLMFSKQATVTYDPNGGTYNGKSENTEITLSSSSSEGITEWTNTKDAVPSDSDKIRFIGWYFARGAQQSDGTYTGALIRSEHSVKYSTQDTTSTQDDTLDVSYVNTLGGTNSSTVDADYGVTFVAQWEYLQKVVAMTKQTSEATYKESSTGGTVSMTIEYSDNQSDSERVVEAGEASSQGYGRLNDIITVTAEAASDSYVFMGWYDEDGNVLSHSYTYSYAVTDYYTVYAHFSADVVYPYLSFISEAITPDTSDALFKQGSHVRVGDEYVWQDRGIIGGDTAYGNTIATGFTLNTKGSTGSTYDHCQWTITIPAGDTYIKIPDTASADIYPFEFESEPILTDTNAQVNNGKIYRVNDLNTETVSVAFVSGFDSVMDDDGKEALSMFIVDGFDSIMDEGEVTYEETNILPEEESAVLLNETTREVILRLYDVLPTVITGESVVSYGIVIDNLYAPQAKAAFELKSYSSGADTDFTDISADEKGKIVHSSTAEEYRADDNNRYSSVVAKEAQ